MSPMRTLHEICEQDGRAVVAERLGIAESTLSNVLNGVRGFHDEKWERALEAYPDMDMRGTLAERSRRRELRSAPPDEAA